MYFGRVCKLFEATYFFIVLGGGTLWHLQKFLQLIEYIIFAFTYVCASICTVFSLLSPFHTTSPFPLVPIPTTSLQDVFFPPILQKKKKEKK
jgi:uncharacterized SAM-binding protein YcdF (DUF218 family)